MKKIIILLATLSFTAVSCNTILFGGSGLMGVFKSDDFGQHFHAVNSIDKKNNLNSVSVNDLVFDPQNSQIIYLAAASGVYRTEDAGNSWKILISNIAVADVVIDPQDPKIIYAAGVAANHAKIIKSSDNGASWHDQYTEPTTQTVVRGITLSPANHMQVTAVLDSGDVIQSPDGGNSWQVISKIAGQPIRMRIGPNKNLYLLTLNNGLFESKDSGLTFINITEALGQSFINFDTESMYVSRYLDFAFDSKQSAVIYLATQEGLLRTVSNGKNWAFVRMPVKSANLRTSTVAVNPQDSNDLYAVIEQTIFRTINGGITWETQPLPTAREVRQILIDPNAVNTIYLGLGVSK